MYFIEGHWETIDNLFDVARIVREYYNYDLANKIEEFAEAENEETQNKRYEKLDELFGLIQDVQNIADRMENVFLDIE